MAIPLHRETYTYERLYEKIKVLNTLEQIKHYKKIKWNNCA